jgi:hypothetical protein
MTLEISSIYTGPWIQTSNIKNSFIYRIHDGTRDKELFL